MFLALTACHHPQEPADPVDVLAEFSEPGPHGVGYRESAVTWSGGLQADPRTDRLAIWFPTDATRGDPVTYDAFVPAPATVMGGVDPIDGPLPLLVFSHGHQAFAESSAFLAEHFASHGWLVLAPDHTDNTTFDGPDRTTAIYWQRPLDLGATLDLAESDWDLTGEIVVSGHSFGGYTAHAVGGATYAPIDCPPTVDDGFCSTMDPDQEALFAQGFRDDRADALIAMAPGDYDLFGDGLAAIDRPELLMTAGLDPNPESDLFWDALSGADDVRVHLPTAGHNAFTVFSGPPLDPASAIDPEEGWRIVRTYALAFAEREARGNPDGEPLLDGELGVSDLATLSLH
jgi:predicted dienelactone hydrolase